MVRGTHGLPKISLEPAMPNPSLPCGRPPLKLPYGRFKGGRAACGHPTTPLGTPRRTPLVLSVKFGVAGLEKGSETEN
jgi:hypothetical protein